MPLHAVDAAADDGDDDEARRRRRFSSLRSVGVDYGLVRTGVAVTVGGYRPRPLAILSGLDSADLASAIVDRVLSERATNVVLGLPLHKNGTQSEQSEITRLFGLRLLCEVRCRCGRDAEVVLWDERYTSKEAASRATAEAMSRNGRIPSASDLSGELDADAACIILEDYYKELGEDAERVVFGDDDGTLEQECDEIYQQNLEREERERRERMDKRERGYNARQEMIERAKALEEQEGTIGSKKKKKKKKKKKR